MSVWSRFTPPVDRAPISAYTALAPAERPNHPWPWAHASHGVHRLRPGLKRITGRSVLYDRQRGLCAMCAIARFDWVQTFGTPCPPPSPRCL